jgi:hypothetical protein
MGAQDAQLDIRGADAGGGAARGLERRPRILTTKTILPKGAAMD